MDPTGTLRQEIETGAEDAALIAGARRGDEAAWAALVRCHQEPVFRLAYLILGHGPETAALAEDVAQETFVRAYQNLDHFEDGRLLRPWLLAIGANLARNRKRSIGRYWAALQRWWQVQRTEKVSETPAPGQRDDARLLWQAIQQLPPAHQEALYLRYFLDMAEAEMAGVLRVAPGTVKSRLYRARQALEIIIEEQYPILYEERHQRQDE